MPEHETPYDAEAAKRFKEGDWGHHYAATAKQTAYREGWTVGWAACVEALRKTDVEWVTSAGERDESLCPCCTNWQSDGHAPDCTLAAILNSVKE